MKIKLPFDNEQYRKLTIHFVLFVIAVVVWQSFLNEVWRWIDELVVNAIFAGVSLILLFSVLDYLDIFELRKTSKRHTKCRICGRSNEKSIEIEEPEDGEGITTSKKEIKVGKRDDDKVITTKKRVPEEPLNGFVVREELICIGCIKTIKEMLKEWP